METVAKHRNMSFSHALSYLGHGYTIRRESWDSEHPSVGPECVEIDWFTETKFDRYGDKYTNIKYSPTYNYPDFLTADDFEGEDWVAYEPVFDDHEQKDD